MIKNFFTVALRSFLRQKFYSVLNVLGLSSGLICALFIFLWVSDELNKNRIIILALSLSTVIYQVTKAAMANPVDALRNE